MSTFPEASPTFREDLCLCWIWVSSQYVQVMNRRSEEMGSRKSMQRFELRTRQFLFLIRTRRHGETGSAVITEIPLFTNQRQCCWQRHEGKGFLELGSFCLDYPGSNFDQALAAKGNKALIPSKKKISNLSSLSILQ